MKTSVAALLAVAAVMVVPAPALAEHAPGNECAEAHHDEPSSSDPAHGEWLRRLNEACNPCAKTQALGRAFCLRIEKCRLFRPSTLAGQIACAKVLMRYDVRAGRDGMVAFKRRRASPYWRRELAYLRHVQRSRR